jgi:carbamoyl-phosphate synthase small subunit
MSYNDFSNPAVLILEDGLVFHGESFGKKGTTCGEICFNTGMTGYQEVFTDPSYYGQIVIMNSVHIGNYGIHDGEVESDSIKVKGIIGRNLEEQYSRFAADNSLQEYFEKQNIVAINGIDSRALVIHVRNAGAMNCIISSEETDIEKLKDILKKQPSMSGMELASFVSTKENYTLGNEQSKVKVAVLDYGIKKNILNCLVERGAYVKVFNEKASFEEIAAFKPDGYFASNGPGDPEPMKKAVTLVQKILEEKKPFFGICLGQQLLALANGIPTYKMHHGHRGLNHPVKNLITGRCEITTQNHGFGVDAVAVAGNENVQITHVNLNDDSIEGIRLKNAPAFAVQYHPESTPGPHDSRYLFDEFFALIESH